MTTAGPGDAARRCPPAALLIDLDGVLRRWPPNLASRAEQEADLPAGAIAEAAFAQELLNEVVTGRISDAQWRRHLSAKLAASYPHARVEAAIAQWSASCGTVDQGVFHLLVEARQNAKVVLVTNATSRLDEDLRRLALDRSFDAVINSSVVGYAKPELRIFEAALAAAGVDAERAMFVDDTAGHVAAANEAGLAAHHFTGVPRLRMELELQGLVPG